MVITLGKGRGEGNAEGVGESGFRRRCLPATLVALLLALLSQTPANAATDLRALVIANANYQGGNPRRRRYHADAAERALAEAGLAVARRDDVADLRKGSVRLVMPERRDRRLLLRRIGQRFDWKRERKIKGEDGAEVKES
ncbi:MAG: hypothetical protein R3F11_25680 [Verrucomicrobiales bacterium]